MLSTQAHLDALDAAINQRLNGGAYNGYSDNGQEFAGESLSGLYKIRENLMQRLAAENGGNFSLAEPFGDGDSRGPIALW
jgi:hypothetical protein